MKIYMQIKLVFILFYFKLNHLWMHFTGRMFYIYFKILKLCRFNFSTLWLEPWHITALGKSETKGFFSTRWSKVTWQRGKSPECLTLEFFSECLRRQTTTNPSLCSDKARGRLLTTQTLWTSNIDHTGLTCWCAPSVEYMMDKTKHNTRNRNTKPRLCQRLKKKRQN